MNLLSPCALVMDGAEINFSPSGVRITTSDGHVHTGSIDHTNKIFILKSESPRVQPHALLAQTSSAPVRHPIHHRLAHPGREKTAAVRRHYAQSGISPIDIATSQSGDACAITQSTQAQHPRRETTTARIPLEVVHIDLIDLANVQTESRYALTIMDDASRYASVIPLTTKSNAVHA